MKKRRTFKNKNNRLYWIIIAYLIVGAFYPTVGLLAIICMLGPVLTAIWKGRWWCGRVCPRGSFWANVMSRVTLGKEPPRWLRHKYWRAFMVVFIFTMFGIQMSVNGFTAAGIGRTFWTIILVTSIVGIILGWLYTPRTWCMFCPMGSLSALVTPTNPDSKMPRVYVDQSCEMKCKSCARYCPMSLKPYESRGRKEGFMHYDCIKCERCTTVCPTKVASMGGGNLATESTVRSDK